MITVEEIKSRIQQGLNTNLLKLKGMAITLVLLLSAKIFKVKVELPDIEWFFFI